MWRGLKFRIFVYVYTPTGLLRIILLIHNDFMKKISFPLVDNPGTDFESY